MLNAVRTEARPIERDLFESKPSVGTVQITARAAEGMPKFGEPDIIRIVQLLPGVEARNDFSTGLNVRGGESDQNLILLDGFPIYNPFHLGGLFSTFIDPDRARRHADHRRISRALRRTPLERARRPFGRRSPAAACTARPRSRCSRRPAALGSAFNGGKGSWMIAGRRTYADKFVDLISTNELPYHFRDEQAHFTYAFTPTLKFSMTAYDGRDQLDASIATFGDSTTGATATGGAFRFRLGQPRRRRLAHENADQREPRRIRPLAARRQHHARAARVAIACSRRRSISARAR